MLEKSVVFIDSVAANKRLAPDGDHTDFEFKWDWRPNSAKPEHIHRKLDRAVPTYNIL
jgi:hypothetical protein